MKNPANPACTTCRGLGEYTHIFYGIRDGDRYLQEDRRCLCTIPDTYMSFDIRAEYSCYGLLTTARYGAKAAFMGNLEELESQIHNYWELKT